MAVLGAPPRTLGQWEQGRRKSSDAAKQLMKIAERHSEILVGVQSIQSVDRLEYWTSTGFSLRVASPLMTQATAAILRGRMQQT